MPELRKELSSLRDPSKIQGALLASSPYVLRKAFSMDPTIQRLVQGGEKVLPWIAEELRQGEDLDEITLSAYVYVVEQVKRSAVREMFAPLFRKSLEKPGMFFNHFVTHALRSELNLPVKPLALVYTQAEQMETQSRIH